MSEMWQFEFMRCALISALILGPTCAFLGVFITLRGMSFFSDAIAHASLTGIALGFWFQEATGTELEIFWVVFGFNIMLALLMAYFVQKTPLSADTIIAFTSTGSVALGVLMLSMLGKYRLFRGLLFGDIYSNGPTDLLRQLLLAAVIFGFVGTRIKGLTLSVLDPDLARGQGWNLTWLNYAFAMLIAGTVAVAIKMLGTLLLGALIVIPPAAAKLLAKSLRQMIFISMGIGLFASALGVYLSVRWDSPTGPTIVLVNVVVLLGALLFRKQRGAC